jgi:signal transduction histidine kinase
VRVRITLASVLVTAIAVGTAGWLLVHSVEDGQIRDLRHQADSYLDELTDRMRNQDPQAALDATEPSPPPGPVKVIDESGQVVASFPETFVRSDEADVVIPEDRAEPQFETEDDGDGDDGEDGGDGVDGEDAMVLPAAIETVTRTVATPDGELTVTAEIPVDQVARSIDTLTGRLTIGLPALVALVGLIAWVLVGRALRPVEAIRAEVERISGSTMHRRVPEPSTRDEVGRLARTMNTMLGRLEGSAIEQRRFVADASHELRSPVAVIRAGLELARSKHDYATWMTMVDSLLAEEARLEALLDDLLLLAANDEHGTLAAPSRPVDLAALTSDEARRPRRVPVQVVEPPADDDRTVVVAGAADQLARALSNLVDNAARHASSVVELGISSDGSMTRLVVDDDGPGIPPKDRERVFERFTRLDDGRARHDGGTGLGLAVVRSVITSHDGNVHVEDSPLGGARFVAVLPTT